MGFVVDAEDDSMAAPVAGAVVALLVVVVVVLRSSPDPAAFSMAGQPAMKKSNQTTTF